MSTAIIYPATYYQAIEDPCAVQGSDAYSRTEHIRGPIEAASVEHGTPHFSSIQRGSGNGRRGSVSSSSSQFAEGSLVENVKRQHVRSWTHYDEGRDEVCIVDLQSCVRLLQPSTVEEDGGSEEMDSVLSETRGSSNPAADAASSGLLLQQAYEWKIWLLPGRSGNLFPDGGSNPVPLRPEELRGCRESSLAKERIREHFGAASPPRVSPSSSNEVNVSRPAENNRAEKSPVIASAVFTVASSPQPLDHVDTGAAMSNASFHPSSSFISGSHVQSDSFSSSFAFSKSTQKILRMTGLDSMDLLHENASLYAGLMGVTFLSSREVIVYTATCPTGDTSMLNSIPLDLFMLLEDNNGTDEGRGKYCGNRNDLSTCNRFASSSSGKLRWRRYPGLIPLPVFRSSSEGNCFIGGSEAQPRLLHFSLLKQNLSADHVDLFYATAASPSRVEDSPKALNAFDIGAGVLRVEKLRAAIHTCGSDEKLTTRLLYSVVDGKRDFSRILPSVNCKNHHPEMIEGHSGESLLPWDCIWLLVPTVPQERSPSISWELKELDKEVLTVLHGYRFMGLVPVPSSPGRGFSLESTVRHAVTVPVRLHCFGCSEMGLLHSADGNTPFTGVGISLPASCVWTDPATSPSAILSAARSDEDRLARRLRESRQAVHVTSLGEPAMRVLSVGETISTVADKKQTGTWYPAMLEMVLHSTTLLSSRAEGRPANSTGLYISSISWTDLRLKSPSDGTRQIITIPRDQDNTCWNGFAPMRLPRDNAGDPSGSQRTTQVSRFHANASSTLSLASFASPPYQTLNVAPHPVTIGSMFNSRTTIVCLQKRPVSEEMRVLCVTFAHKGSPGCQATQLLSDLTFTPPTSQLFLSSTPPPGLPAAETRPPKDDRLQEIISSFSPIPVTGVQKLVEWIVAVVMETFSKEEEEEHHRECHTAYDEEKMNITNGINTNPYENFTQDTVSPLFSTVSNMTMNATENLKETGRSSSPAVQGKTRYASSKSACAPGEPPVTAWMAASIMVHSLWRRLCLEGNNDILLGSLLQKYVGNEPQDALGRSTSLLQNPFLEDIPSIEKLDSETLARMLLRHGMKDFISDSNSSDVSAETQLLELSRYWRVMMEQLLITLDWWSTTKFSVQVMRCVALLFLGVAGVPKEVEDQMRLFLKRSVPENQSLGGAAMKSPEERLRHCLRQLSLVGTSTNRTSTTIEMRVFPTSNSHQEQDGNMTFLNLTLLTPAEAVVSRFLLQIAGALEGEMHAELAAWKKGVARPSDISEKELDDAPTPSALLWMYVHRRLEVPLELIFEDFWCSGHPGVSLREPNLAEVDEDEEEEEDRAEMLAAQRRSIGHVLLEVVDPNQLWASTQLFMNSLTCTTMLSSAKQPSHYSTAHDVEYCVNAIRGLWRLLGQWTPAVYIEFSVNNLGLGLPALMVEMLSTFSREHPAQSENHTRWCISLDAAWQRWISVVSSSTENGFSTEAKIQVEQVLTSFLSILFQDDAQHGSIELYRSPFFRFFSASSVSVHSFHLLATLHVIQRLLQSVERKHLAPYADRIRRTKQCIANTTTGPEPPHRASFNEDGWSEPNSDDDWLVRESDAKEHEVTYHSPPFVMSPDSPAIKWCESHDADLLKLYKGVAVLRWLCQDDPLYANQIRDALLVVAENYGQTCPVGEKRLLLCFSAFAQLLPSASSQNSNSDGTESALVLAMRNAEKSSVLPLLYEVIHLAMTTDFVDGLFNRLVWLTGLIYEKSKPMWSTSPRHCCPLYSLNEDGGDTKACISTAEDIIALILFVENRGERRRKSKEMKYTPSSAPLSTLNRNETAQLIGVRAKKYNNSEQEAAKKRLISVPMVLLSFWQQLWNDLFVRQPYAATNTILLTRIRRVMQGQLQLAAPAPLSRVTYIEAVLCFCCDSALLPFFLHAYPTLLSLVEEENQMMASMSSPPSEWPAFANSNVNDRKNSLCQIELASSTFPYTNSTLLTSNEVLSKFLSELHSILQSAGNLKERGILAPSAGAPLVDRRCVRCYECAANTLLQLSKLIPRNSSTASMASPAVAAHQRTSSLSFPSTVGSPVHLRTASRSAQWRDEDSADGRPFPDFYFPPPQAYFFATQLFTHDGAKLLVAGEMVRRQMREYVLSYLLYHRLLEPILCSGSREGKADCWVWFTAAKIQNGKNGMEGKNGDGNPEEIVLPGYPSRLPEPMKLWNVKNYLNDCVERLDACGDIFSRAGQVVEEVYANSGSGASLWNRKAGGGTPEEESENEEKRSLSLAVFYSVLQLVLFFDVHHSLFLTTPAAEFYGAHPMLISIEECSPTSDSSGANSTLHKRYWREIGLVCVANETVDEMQRLIRKVVFERYSSLSFDQQQILRLIVREEFRPLLFTDLDKPLPKRESKVVPHDSLLQTTHSPHAMEFDKSATSMLPPVFLDAGEHVVKEMEEPRSPSSGRQVQTTHVRTDSAFMTAEHLLGDVALLSSIKQLCREEAQERQHLIIQLANENMQLWIHNSKDPLCKALNHLYVSRRYSSPSFINALLAFAAEQKDILFTFTMKWQQRVYEEFTLERRRLQVHLIEIWQQRLSTLRQRERDTREEIEVKWQMGLEHYREDATQLFDFYWREVQGRAMVLREWEEGLDDLLYTQLELEEEREWEDAVNVEEDSAMSWREALETMASLLPPKTKGFGKNVPVHNNHASEKPMKVDSHLDGKWSRSKELSLAPNAQQIYSASLVSTTSGPTESSTGAVAEEGEDEDLGDPIQSGAAAFAKIGGSVFSAFKNLRNKFEEKPPENVTVFSSQPSAVPFYPEEVAARNSETIIHENNALQPLSDKKGAPLSSNNHLDGWSDDDNGFNWEEESDFPTKKPIQISPEMGNGIQSIDPQKTHEFDTASGIADGNAKIVLLKSSKRKVAERDDDRKAKDEKKPSFAAPTIGSMGNSPASSPVSLAMDVDASAVMKVSKKKKGLGGVARVLPVKAAVEFSEMKHLTEVKAEPQISEKPQNSSPAGNKLPSLLTTNFVNQRMEEEALQGIILSDSVPAQGLPNQVLPISTSGPIMTNTERILKEKKKKGLGGVRSVQVTEMENVSDCTDTRSVPSITITKDKSKRDVEHGMETLVAPGSEFPDNHESAPDVTPLPSSSPSVLESDKALHGEGARTTAATIMPPGAEDDNRLQAWHETDAITELDSVPLPQKSNNKLIDKGKGEVSVKKGTKKTKGLGGAKPLATEDGSRASSSMAMLANATPQIKTIDTDPGELDDEDDFPLKKVNDNARRPALNFDIPLLEINEVKDDSDDHCNSVLPLPPLAKIPSPPADLSTTPAVEAGAGGRGADDSSLNEEDRLLKESVLRLVEDESRSPNVLAEDVTDPIAMVTLPPVLQSDLHMEVKNKLCSDLDAFLDTQEQIRGDVTIAEALERLHLVRRFVLELTG